MATEGKRRPGRPRVYSLDCPRKSTTIALRNPLRAELKAAAEKAERSLAGEILWRLEMSLQYDGVADFLKKRNPE
jgi:hypothetical protein